VLVAVSAAAASVIAVIYGGGISLSTAQDDKNDIFAECCGELRDLLSRHQEIRACSPAEDSDGFPFVRCRPGRQATGQVLPYFLSISKLISFVLTGVHLRVMPFNQLSWHRAYRLSILKSSVRIAGYGFPAGFGAITMSCSLGSPLQGLLSSHKDKC
jgi:hypothetical protein